MVTNNRIKRLFLHAALTLTLAGLGCGMVRADDSPRLVPAELARRVAERYAEDSQGVVGFQVRTIVDIAAPLVGGHREERGWFVLADGAVAATGGANTLKPPPAVREPYRTADQADYRFAFAACDGCDSQHVALAFASQLHDALHSSGTMTIDSRTARIEAIVSQPYVLPKPARSGTMRTQWGAQGNSWSPKAVQGEFAGRFGPFSGHATINQTLFDYQHFSSVASAEATLRQRVSEGSRT